MAEYFQFSLAEVRDPERNSSCGNLGEDLGYVGKNYLVFSRVYSDLESGEEKGFYEGSLKNVAEYLSDLVQGKNPEYSKFLSGFPVEEYDGNGKIVFDLQESDLEEIVNRAGLDKDWKIVIFPEGTDPEASYLF